MSSINVDEIIKSALEKARKFQYEQERTWVWDRCPLCKDVVPLFHMMPYWKCRHRICPGCYKLWKNEIESTGRWNSTCPICGKPAIITHSFPLDESKITNDAKNVNQVLKGYSFWSNAYKHRPKYRFKPFKPYNPNNNSTKAKTCEVNGLETILEKKTL